MIVTILTIIVNDTDANQRSYEVVLIVHYVCRIVL